MKKNDIPINIELLYAALTADPDPALQAQWQQARSVNPQYDLLYQEMKPLFEQADEPEWADLYKHLDRINRLHQVTPQPNGQERRIPAYRHWWWVAAIVTGICVGAWWILQLTQPGKAIPITWKKVQAPEGRTTLLHFPDGSVVSLSPASLISFPNQFEPTKREVYLKGEAFFTIAKDSMRPFLVHSGPITTRVTGTAFAVKGDSTTGEYEVQLVEGTVSLLQAQEQGEQVLANLLPQQSFQFNQSDAHWHIEPMSARETAAIASGGFVFRNTPLKKIARQLELYYGVAIGFEQSNIKQLEFTAYFERPTLNHILQVLEASGKISIHRRQNKLIFSHKQ